MSIAITTPDELNALTAGSVVLTQNITAWQKEEQKHPYHWRSTKGTITDATTLLSGSKRGLVLIYTPHYPGEDGTAISDPDYLHTQRTIAGVICDSPHPLMLTEIHDLAYQIADALVKACIIPAPRPKDDAGDEGRYRKREGVIHKAMVAAEEAMYAALGPDYDTDALARYLIGRLEDEGCLATRTQD